MKLWHYHRALVLSGMCPRPSIIVVREGISKFICHTLEDTLSHEIHCFTFQTAGCNLLWSEPKISTLIKATHKTNSHTFTSKPTKKNTHKQEIPPQADVVITVVGNMSKMLRQHKHTLTIVFVTNGNNNNDNNNDDDGENSNNYSNTHTKSTTNDTLALLQNFVYTDSSLCMLANTIARALLLTFTHTHTHNEYNYKYQILD